MKKFKNIILLLLIFAMILPIFSACAEKEVALTNKGKTTNVFFSTETKVSLFDDFTKQENLDKFDRAWNDCKQILSQIENLCSLSVSDSDISKFNELKFGESIVVSETTAKIFQIAKTEFDKSNGLFDPTIYPLVDLWGFSPRFNDFNYTPTTAYDRKRVLDAFPLPDEKYIDAFLQLVDFSNVVLSYDEKIGYTLAKNIPDVTVDGVTYSAKLDFGGIAKGYAVEQMTKILQNYGYEYGYISCGSSSMALMKNYSPTTDTERYNLAINKPRDGANLTSPIFAKVKVSDASLSSSGDYEHNYFLDGKNYCHIINPFTGYPVNVSPNSDKLQVGVSTITLIGGSADYDDALTTALLLMPFDELIAYINENLSDRMIVLVIFKENEDTFEVVTNITDDKIDFFDDAYLLSSKLENGKVVYTGTYFE